MNTYILPIHHMYAARIYDGTKRYEIRRRIPRLQPGDRILLYETSPISRVTGEFTVEKVYHGDPDYMYKRHGGAFGIAWKDYQRYVDGLPLIFAIRVSKPRIYACSMHLLEFGLHRAPQSFLRLTAK